MAQKIEYSDNLKKGTDKLNESIQQSNVASQKAITAEQTANQAIQQSESTQTQLDNIVIEGDSSVEAAQARVDSKGESFPTLKSRLDNFEVSATQQLQQMAINIKTLGADTNGTGDMISLINSAIETAYSRGGGTVFFPSGVYQCIPTNDNFIILRDNVDLIGTGQSILKVSNDNPDFDFLISGKNSKIQNVTIQGMVFDTNVSNNRAPVSLTSGQRRIILRAQLASDIRIRDCKFYYSGVNAVILQGAMYGHRNIYINDNYFYFEPQGVSHYDNTALYIGQIAHLIIGNTFEGEYSSDYLAPRAVTCIESHSSYGIVDSNTISGFSSGVLILGPDYGMEDATDKGLVQKNISNNIIRKCLNGITFWPGNRDIHHVNIVNNVIDINNADRNRPAQNAYGIALTHPMGGSPMRNLVSDVLIANNNIKFQAPDEWLFTETTDESDIYMGAFGIGALGRSGETVSLRNISIFHNVITNAPRQAFSFASEGEVGNQFRDIIIKNNTIYNPVTQIRTQIEYRALLLLFGKVTNLIFENNITIDSRDKTALVKEIHLRGSLTNFKNITSKSNSYLCNNRIIGQAKHLPTYLRPSDMIVNSEYANKLSPYTSAEGIEGKTFEINDGYLLRTPSSSQTVIALASKEGTQKTLSLSLTGVYSDNQLKLPENSDIPFQSGEFIEIKIIGGETTYSRIIGIDYIGKKIILGNVSSSGTADVEIKYSKPNFVSIAKITG